MIFLGTIALGLVVAYSTRHKPWQAVQVSLVMWLAVPAAVVADFSHTPLDASTFLHPSSAVLIAGAFVQFGMNGDHARTVVAQYRVGLSALIFALAWALGTCLIYGRGYSLIVNQLISPVLAFLLVGLSMRISPGSVYKIGRTVVLGAGAVAVIAIVGTLQGTTSLYARQMNTVYPWFTSDAAVSRHSSSLDSPLVLAFVGAAALPLIGVFRSVLIKLCLASLAVFASLASESRTGTIVCAVIILFLIVQRRSSARTRAAAVLLGVAGYFAIVRLDLASGVAARFAFDNGSAGARSIAWENFLGHLSSYVAIGLGPGASRSFAQSLGMPTSFESALACLAIDFGVLFGIAYFGGQVLIWVRALRTSQGQGVPGALLAASVALFFVQTFSSTANESAVSMVQWVILGLAAFGRLLPPRPVSTGGSVVRASSGEPTAIGTEHPIAIYKGRAL